MFHRFLWTPAAGTGSLYRCHEQQQREAANPIPALLVHSLVDGIGVEVLPSHHTNSSTHTRAQYWCVHFSCIVHIEPVMFKADWPLMTTEDCFAVLFAPDGHTKAPRIGMQLCCTVVLTLDPSHRRCSWINAQCLRRRQCSYW